MIIFVGAGVFITYSKTGISTYRAEIASIGEKNNVLYVRVMNDNQHAKVFGDYTIRTLYGNISLKDKAAINVRENILTNIRGSHGRMTLGRDMEIHEIYTDNFLSDTLQTDISIFEYDKNTKLSNIGNLKFNVSSFILYAKKIDFIIKGSHTFTINEVEIDIPVTGAVLSYRRQ
jgi:hypothetical protein